MTDLETRIRGAVDEIRDPCSQAQGLDAGLVEMGLLLSIEAVPGGLVALRMRVTGPGCLYVVLFERELRQRIMRIEGVTSVSIEWVAANDWSPSNMAPALRARTAERRRILLSQAPRRL